MEEEFITDLNSNNHRLDNLISCVRAIMKVDPYNKRTSPSPLGKSMIKRTTEKDKSNKRLIERVEKAINEQVYK